MLKEELIMKNPVRILNPGPGDGVPDHRLGLVMARAGVGKTAILVQISMDCLLRGYKVLHVSIGQSLEKTKVWYHDVFRSITEGQRQDETAHIMDEVLRNRMIMTFKESSFSRPKLEERLNDLVYQNIFKPDCMVVDGYNFTGADREAVEDIKELMTAMDLHVWFSAVCHREDTRMSEVGVPAPCHDVDDLFDTVIVLKPREEGIRLNIVKDCAGCGEVGRILNLDPATMMIRET